jgi:hypothetical protein
MGCDVKLRKGSYPIAIERTLKDEKGVAVNVSGASSLAFRLRSPSGIRKEFAAILSGTGTDGKVRWISSSAADLDEVGTWRGQFFIGLGGGVIASDDFSFEVAIVLEYP